MSENTQVGLVGILNLSRNSIDGGTAEEHAVTKAENMFSDGAEIIDVGAEATNPWAKPIGADSEWKSLEPTLEELIPRFRSKISIDTHHPQTVRRILSLAGSGNFIINDVTTFIDPRMIEAAASSEVICIASHLPEWADGNVQAVHDPANRDRLQDSPNQVAEELTKRIEKMIEGGIKRESIVADPGIGFGKTPKTNWELLKFAELFSDYPVLIGYSHKRFLATDQKTGEELPDANHLKTQPALQLQAGRIAIASGARYLRVHEVELHKQLLRLQK